MDRSQRCVKLKYDSPSIIGRDIITSTIDQLSEAIVGQHPVVCSCCTHLSVGFYFSHVWIEIMHLLCMIGRKLWTMILT